jgi:hypothetical protein
VSRYDPDLGPVPSALTLPLWLAGFGLVVCAAGAAVRLAVGAPWPAAVLVLLAVVAAAALAVLGRRKRGGRPG